ncbi:hypothetical protein [Spirosoma horti]
MPALFLFLRWFLGIYFSIRCLSGNQSGPIDSMRIQSTISSTLAQLMLINQYNFLAQQPSVNQKRELPVSQ